MKPHSSQVLKNLFRACELFKEVRKAAGLSQVEFAQCLNVSQAQVSKVENQNLTPSLIQWASFCSTFQIPFDAFYSEASARLAIERFKKVAEKFATPAFQRASRLRNQKIDQR